LAAKFEKPKLGTLCKHSGPENLKKSRPKNSSNEMNHFDGIFFGYFAFSDSKILMENIQKKFREIDLFHFTSFLAWIS
jgi:hypothetical protein